MNTDCANVDYRLMDIKSTPASGEESNEENTFTDTSAGSVLQSRRCFLLRRPCWFGICCAAMAFFIAAAVVQHNDPDPVIWISVYIAPVVCTIGILWIAGESKRGTLASKLLAVAVMSYILACVTGAAVLFWHLITAEVAAHELFVYEEGRELFGLLICCLWVVICYCTTTRLERRDSKPLLTLMICSSLLAVVPAALWTVCLVPAAANSVDYCAAMLSTHQNASLI